MSKGYRARRLAETFCDRYGIHGEMPVRDLERVLREHARDQRVLCASDILSTNLYDLAGTGRLFCTLYDKVLNTPEPEEDV